MKLIVKWIGCLALCLCMSCAEQVESPEMVDTFPDIYPDYIAVTVPVAHLYALYPSDQISVDQTPELAEAAKKTPRSSCPCRRRSTDE